MKTSNRDFDAHSIKPKPMNTFYASGTTSTYNMQPASNINHHHNHHHQQQQHHNRNKDNVTLLNMRVTANSSQGHRKYMEDCYKIRFQRDTSSAGAKHDLTHHGVDTNNNNQSDILFSYFAIFDGHGGKEAAQYSKEKLYWKIIEQDDFWSNDDAKILNAIRNGFVKCHTDMWKELPNWPKTASGLPSTSGTTATVLFIKKNKAYVGHVGDSGIVIGYTKSPTDSTTGLNTPWYGRKLTRDHKPEDPIELRRIQNSGGSVMSKSGVNRVVWNRPIFNNTNNLNAVVAKSQSNLPLHASASTPYALNYLKNQPNVPTERVPFLAVARSLGDLWSYDTAHDEFIVSPVPDVFSFELDPRVHKCLILATDGLWNIMKSSECVELARHTDRETEALTSKSAGKYAANKSAAQPFVNPSQRLVNTAIQRCCEKMIRADNTSCITIMLDLPADYKLKANEPPVLNRTMFERMLQNKSNSRLYNLLTLINLLAFLTFLNQHSRVFQKVIRLSYLSNIKKLLNFPKGLFEVI